MAATSMAMVRSFWFAIHFEAVFLQVWYPLEKSYEICYQYKTGRVKHEVYVLKTTPAASWYASGQRIPRTLVVAQPYPRGLCRLLGVTMAQRAGWCGHEKLKVAVYAKVGNMRVGEAKNPGPRPKNVRPRHGSLFDGELVTAQTLALQARQLELFQNWCLQAIKDEDLHQFFSAVPLFLAQALVGYAESGGALSNLRHLILACLRWVPGSRVFMQQPWEMVEDKNRSLLFNIALQSQKVWFNACVSWRGNKKGVCMGWGDFISFLWCWAAWRGWWAPWALAFHIWPYPGPDNSVAPLADARDARLLHLVRHGQATHNVALAKGEVPKEESRLTELGREQAALSWQLPIAKPEVVLTSPLTRCVETAFLAFPGSKVVALEELRELISGSQHNSQPCRAELAERFPEACVLRSRDWQLTEVRATLTEKISAQNSYDPGKKNKYKGPQHLSINDEVRESNEEYREEYLEFKEKYGLADLNNEMLAENIKVLQNEVSARNQVIRDIETKFTEYLRGYYQNVNSEFQMLNDRLAGSTVEVREYQAELMVAAQDDEGSTMRIQDLEQKRNLAEDVAKRIYEKGMVMREEYQDQDQVSQLRGMLEHTEDRIHHMEANSEHVQSVANHLHCEGLEMQTQLEYSIVQHRERAEMASITDRFTTLELQKSQNEITALRESLELAQRGNYFNEESVKKIVRECRMKVSEANQQKLESDHQLRVLHSEIERRRRQDQEQNSQAIADLRVRSQEVEDLRKQNERLQTMLKVENETSQDYWERLQVYVQADEARQDGLPSFGGGDRSLRVETLESEVKIQQLKINDMVDEASESKSPANKPKKIDEPCWNWAKGSCKFGDKCRRRHDQHLFNTAPSTPKSSAAPALLHDFDSDDDDTVVKVASTVSKTKVKFDMNDVEVIQYEKQDFIECSRKGPRSKSRQRDSKTTEEIRKDEQWAFDCRIARSRGKAMSILMNNDEEYGGIDEVHIVIGPQFDIRIKMIDDEYGDLANEIFEENYIEHIPGKFGVKGNVMCITVPVEERDKKFIMDSGSGHDLIARRKVDRLDNEMYEGEMVGQEVHHGLWKWT
eukprot:s3930_g2.t1